MELHLIINESATNVINKELEVAHTIPLNIRNDVDIVNPRLFLTEVAGVQFSHFNYAYITEFDRYYFITDREYVKHKTWLLTLECDVLETYKADILASYANYSRAIKPDDYVDFSTDRQVLKQIDIYKSDTILENESSIILSTIGGVN